MNPALVVRLRPTGPWRSGPDSGARNRVDAIYHSDTLYAAVTSAMASLGLLEDWLAATAAASGAPAVRFSSCFPFVDEIELIVPPRTLWPPSGVTASRVRWKSARFVPVSVIETLVNGKSLSQDHWTVDGESECLLPSGHQGPFRTHLRWNAAVDRLSGCTERHATACLEFRPGAGLWVIAVFEDPEKQARWAGPVRAALRLLADSGFGGERSRGWGRSEEPEFVEGTFPDVILPGRPAADASPEPELQPYWLLSLFAPAPDDAVDWTQGNYCTVTRGGRIGSPAAYGVLKKQLNMVSEGSVLLAGGALRGAAPDVAPDGMAHPVYRAGFALTVALPRRERPVRPVPPPVEVVAAEPAVPEPAPEAPAADLSEPPAAEVATGAELEPAPAQPAAEPPPEQPAAEPPPEEPAAEPTPEQQATEHAPGPPAAPATEQPAADSGSEPPPADSQTVPEPLSGGETGGEPAAENAWDPDDRSGEVTP